MAEEGLRQFFKISCPCGTALRLDPLKADRRQRCPKCGLLLDFVVTMDGRSRRPRVSIVVSADAMNLEGESLASGKGQGREQGQGGNREQGQERGREQEREPEPEPEPKAPPRTRVGGKTSKAVLGTCICGTSFPVDDHELTSIQACPQCAIEYHVVVKMERGTRKRTAILVPVKTVPTRRPSIAPPPSTRSGKRTQVPAKARTRVELPPGAQSVACSCGEALVVRKRDVAKGMSCPSCARALKFQEVPDPQTLIPVIRIRPEAKK